MGKDRQRKRKHEDKRSQRAEGDKPTAHGMRNKDAAQKEPQESVRVSRGLQLAASKSEEQQQVGLATVCI